MMASRPFASSSAYGLIDFAVPALAGFAVVFVAFAAPIDLLEEAVSASGLPGLLAAAAPPLGGKARILLGLGGGAAVFAFAFGLLRLIDRPTARPPRAVPVLVDEPAPRVRGRDLHPDAPPRPPVLAMRELGEPAPPEPGQVVEPEPEPAPTPEPMAEVVAKPAPRPVSPEESLADLMARLEQGLARRASARRQVETEPVPTAGPQVVPHPSDDRLASAIENLQRLAALRREQAAG